LRVGALALLVGAASCLVVAVRDDAPAAAAPTPPSDLHVAATPLLSARRAPFVFANQVALVRLQRAVAAHAEDAGVCIAVDDPGRPGVRLAAAHDDTPLAPASTLKLLTGAAALSALGPDHRFVTRVVRRGDDLYLVGGGDPVLSTPGYAQLLHSRIRTRRDPVTDLATLADAVAATGVTSVRNLIADDSHADDLRFLPVWRPNYASDVGPLGALTVDDGRANGTRVSDPALNAAAQLRTLLIARGVTVGAVARAKAPRGSREVASIKSPPVADLVAGMLTSSDNDTAEMLAREVGIARGGKGTTAAGTTAITRELEGLGVETKGVHLDDGSGLARGNRVTCRALIDTIELSSNRKFAALDKGLPVAGRTGTLTTRATDLDGVLRAKTGYIEGVAGLAGIVDDAQHLRFAYLANGAFSESAGRAAADDVARVIAAYPQTPSDRELVPPP